MDSLLSSIGALGEQMLEALENNDLSAFEALLQQRQQLVNQLAESQRSQSIPKYESASTQLVKAQYELLMDALRQKEDAAMQSLHDINRLKDASRSYGSSSGMVKKILNPNLRG